MSSGMSRRGSLIVLSGFSGVGKGTVLRKMMGTYDNYAYSVSATTRKPREGEVDGKDYFFVTKEKFEDMIAHDQLLEHACYVDHYYGTPRQYVEDRMNEGKDVILEIEVNGALNIRKLMPEAVLIYMLPPDAQTLKERLTGRGTEKAEVIADRLKKAAEEAQKIDRYDYVIVNDDADACAEDLHRLIQAQHCRTKVNLALIGEICSELEKGLD